jgi:hypothetical protein
MRRRIDCGCRVSSMGSMMQIAARMSGSVGDGPIKAVRQIMPRLSKARLTL